MVRFDVNFSLMDVRVAPRDAAFIHTFETISARRSKPVVHHPGGRKSQNPGKTAPNREGRR
ncbi:MAG: hypothetical protein H7316_09680 [Tardiphaga sp.]|nr:hypothetical protein [Tardiphaga sp.]